MADSGIGESDRHDARGGAVNPASPKLPSALFEHFLGAGEAARLLRFALKHEERFIPSTLQRSTGLAVDETVRRSFDYDGPLAEWSGAIDAALRARLPELAASVGVPPFQLDEIESRSAPTATAAITGGTWTSPRGPRGKPTGRTDY